MWLAVMSTVRVEALPAAFPSRVHRLKQNPAEGVSVILTEDPYVSGYVPAAGVVEPPGPSYTLSRGVSAACDVAIVKSHSVSEQTDAKYGSSWEYVTVAVAPVPVTPLAPYTDQPKFEGR